MVRTAVERPRLVEQLASSPQARVALVVAPAGSGKTVLLSDWTRGDGAAWVGVERRHDDAVVFARDLVASLAAVHPTVEASLSEFASAGGQRLGPTFVEALCAALASSPCRAVLVLDDLHHLTNLSILEDLDDLIVGLPAGAQVLIGSRWDPPLRLGRFRVSDHIVEVRADDLAFDDDEGRALLRLVTDRDITGHQAEALVERTEGWAAGLQLAGLSMRRHDDLDGFIAGFTGDDRLVADYLTGEVLRTLDPPTRRFLLRTSVLEWLTPALCDAVTGGDDGATMMRSLVGQGLLTPLGDAHDRHRYHHLFADLLRYQLAAEDPSAVVDARRRAAQWLLGHRELRAGVEQCLAVDDVDQAFGVLSTVGLQYFERGESATLVKWLTRIAAQVDPAPPTVVVNLLAAQIAAEQYDTARETHRRLVGRADLTDGERLAAHALGVQIGMGGLPTSEVHRWVREADELLAVVDRSTVVDFLGGGGADSCETLLGHATAIAHFHDDDVDRAVAGLERVAELPGTQYPIWRVNTLGSLALCHAWQGRLTESERLSRAALETAAAFGSTDHISAIPARFALTIVHLDRLEMDDAARHLAAATTGTLRCRRPTNHHVLELLQTRWAAATEGVEAALRCFRSSPAAGALHPLTVAAQLHLHVELLLRSDSVDEAVELLRRSPYPAHAARIDASLATKDVAGARRTLEAWPQSVHDVRSTVERRIRAAFVLLAEGNTGAAGNQIAEAATLAETEALLGPFTDSPRSLSLLRTSAPTRPLRHFRSVLAAAPDADRRSAANHQLVEPLTVRELGVLAYLPSRLTNGEIASALYISVNTLKTHLRSIYRKLAVDDRDAAVARASTVGLI